MATYAVQVTAGPYTWSVTDDDPPTAGLMDPLTVGWSLPDDLQRPAQPDPMVAQFSLIVATAADVDQLKVGDLVTVDVTFNPPKDRPDVAFIGRVAQGEAEAHPRGMLYRFTCADLTTDLVGYDIGADPLPVQSVATRQAAMINASGLVASDFTYDPVVTSDPNLLVELVEDPAAAPLLDSMVALWDQVALDGLAELAGQVYYRAIVAPYPKASSLGIGYAWTLDAVPDAYVPTYLTPLPGVFGPWFPAPDSYGIRIDPDDRAAGVIDACVVEFESTWAALVPAVVNTAAVTWLYAADTALETERVGRVTRTAENPPPAGQAPTQATRETSTIGRAPGSASVTAATANAGRLGRLMVPPPQNPAGWGPDTFRWLLYADEPGRETFPVIFPRHDLTGSPTPRALRTAAYVRPIVVTPVPNRWNAADATRDWVAGQLTNVQLTIEEGRPVVEFTLAPTVPAPGNPDTALYRWDAAVGTWDEQADTWDDRIAGRPAFRWTDVSLTGVTWDQMHPQPWDMYRLARGTT